jgi:hypothetical protein
MISETKNIRMAPILLLILLLIMFVPFAALFMTRTTVLLDLYLCDGIIFRIYRSLFLTQHVNND